MLWRIRTSPLWVCSSLSCFLPCVISCCPAFWLPAGSGDDRSGDRCRPGAALPALPSLQKVLREPQSIKFLADLNSDSGLWWIRVSPGRGRDACHCDLLGEATARSSSVKCGNHDFCSFAATEYCCCSCCCNVILRSPGTPPSVSQKSPRCRCLQTRLEDPWFEIQTGASCKGGALTVALLDVCIVPLAGMVQGQAPCICGLFQL